VSHGAPSPQPHPLQPQQQSTLEPISADKAYPIYYPIIPLHLTILLNSLLVFVYDMLRRRGMERSAELLAQEAELTTEMLGSCLLFVSNAVGSSSSTSAVGGTTSGRTGFLGQFWGMLWDVLVARLSGSNGSSGSNNAPGTPGLSGILSQMMLNSNNSSTSQLGVRSTIQQDPTVSTTSEAQQRLRLNMAMASTGLSGRDTATLTSSEKAALTTALQAMPSLTHPLSSPLLPSLPSANSNLTAIQQQLMQYQMMLAQQQKQHQMLMQQYQILVQQVRSPKPILPASASASAKPPTGRQQQQMPGQMSMEAAEDAMLSYLQGTLPVSPRPIMPGSVSAQQQQQPLGYFVPGQPPQAGAPQYMQQQFQPPQAGRTAIESIARRSSNLLHKRRISDDGNSAYQYHHANDLTEGGSTSSASSTAAVDAFLNMPSFDEDGASTGSGEDDSTANGDAMAAALDLHRLAVFEGLHSDRLASVHASADGMLAAATGRDMRVSIYSLPERKLLGILPITHKDRVTRARFAQAGKRRLLATCSFDHQVHLWDLGASGERLEASALPSAPTAMYGGEGEEQVAGLLVSVDLGGALNPETGCPDALATCDTTGTLLIRSLRHSGRILHRAQIQSSSSTTTAAGIDGSSVRMLAFPYGPASHDRWIALAVEDRVDVWDWRDSRVAFVVRSPNGRPVIGVTWETGLILVTTDAECYLWAIDIAADGTFTGRQVARLPAPSDKLTSAIFVPSSGSTENAARYILLGSYKKIGIWQVPSYQSSTHLLSASSVTSRKGQPSAADERGMQLVRWVEGAHEDMVSCLACCMDVDQQVTVVSGGSDSRVVFWRLQPGLPPPVVPGGGGGGGDLTGLTGSTTMDQMNHEDQMDNLQSLDMLNNDHQQQQLDFDPIAMFLNTDDL